MPNFLTWNAFQFCCMDTNGQVMSKKINGQKSKQYTMATNMAGDAKI